MCCSVRHGSALRVAALCPLVSPPCFSGTYRPHLSEGPDLSSDICWTALCSEVGGGLREGGGLGAGRVLLKALLS